MAKYSIGEKVLVTRYGLEDEPGIVRYYETMDKTYAIELSRPHRSGGASTHDCDGHVESGFGYWMSESHLKKDERKEVKSMKKIDVGDTVMIRYWDDMAFDEGMQVKATYLNRPEIFIPFSNSMKYLCGKKAVVKSIRGLEVDLENWESGITNTSRWSFTTWMISLVEKKKPEPVKKKLTVAEVEKIIGYGVEIIKG